MAIGRRPTLLRRRSGPRASRTATTSASSTATSARSRAPTLAVGPGPLTPAETSQLPLDYVTDHLQHGYARTVHKTQGSPARWRLLLGDDTLYAELGYTGLTRGSDENHLYTVVGRAERPRRPRPSTHVIRALDTQPGQDRRHRLPRAGGLDEPTAARPRRGQQRDTPRSCSRRRSSAAVAGGHWLVGNLAALVGRRRLLSASLGEALGALARLPTTAATPASRGTSPRARTSPARSSTGSPSSLVVLLGRRARAS